VAVEAAAACNFEGMQFADILLPLHIPRLLTYRVPADINSRLVVGMRVVVPLRNKLYTGIIRQLHTKAPVNYQPKEISDILDPEPLLSETVLAFWDWMAAYYLCYPGDVMLAALPALFRISSETRLMVHPAYLPDQDSMSDDAFLVMEGLETNGELTLADVQRILGRKNVIPLVRDMVECQWVLTRENLQQGVKEKREAQLRLATHLLADEGALRQLFEELEKAPKQLEALMLLLHLSPDGSAVARKKLLKDARITPAAIKALVDKKIVEQELVRIDRLPLKSDENINESSLSDAQNKAYQQIIKAWETKAEVLLHGVTGSGKTLVYVKLLREQLEAGFQVLYMVPEIALTTQLIKRLRHFLGGDIGVYHSRFNDQERAEIWQKVADGRLKMVLGARSAVFLPFTKLGLIIIDEEHDASFKQDDPAPRYHGRDAAIMLAKRHAAKVLMGSATPAIESYYLARSGRYGYVRLDTRYSGVALPEMILADTRLEKRENLMKAELTFTLFQAITDTLARGEQVILLQNRRGYVPYTECSLCGWSPECPNCDITLNYHKMAHQWRCHYCGHKTQPTPSCQACGSTALTTRGFGTEKIEEALEILFPEARIGRLDQDATRKKNAYAQIIGAFENGSLQILVGTQMVSKGLDFENVTLVGVLNADLSLRMPDFRAQERTFQLIEQVSGRAGRRDKKGCVIIQTSQAQNPIFSLLLAHDYDSFADSQLQERLQTQYPPYVRLIRITIRHKVEAVVESLGQELAKRLQIALQHRVLGPATPVIGRIRQEYIRELLIKLERDKLDPAKVKAFLLEQLEWMESEPRWKGMRIVLDVDPA
jgi:primosomal protein N' (replication factor Y)